MTFDPSLDYLDFDFLVSVDYQSATADGEWGSAVTVNNCSVFDVPHTANASADTDFVSAALGIIIRIPEWSDLLAAEPQRGDQFTYNGTLYTVQSVIADYSRLKQWYINAYSIPGPT